MPDGLTVRPYRQTARAAASRKLRDSILDAFLVAMTAHWLDEITLDAVAAGAGTTRQTVIRLFGNKAGLLAAAVEAWPSKLKPQIMPPHTRTPEALAAATVAGYEAFGGMFLRANALVQRHPELWPMLAVGRAAHRDSVRTIFADRLAQADPADAERMLSACLIATDAYTWSLLRHVQGKSIQDTVAIIAWMLTLALHATGPVGAA